MAIIFHGIRERGRVTLGIKTHSARRLVERAMEHLLEAI